MRLSGPESRGKRVLALRRRDFPEVLAPRCIASDNVRVGPFLARGTPRFLFVALFLGFVLSYGIVEQDLASFDAARVQLCRIRRAGDVVFYILWCEGRVAVELDTLVLRGVQSLD